MVPTEEEKRRALQQLTEHFRVIQDNPNLRATGLSWPFPGDFSVVQVHGVIEHGEGTFQEWTVQPNISFARVPNSTSCYSPQVVNAVIAAEQLG